ncbi:AAA family ATPase [Halosimplex pelagicum]|uniref:AAA family ATPase n=1 Tax=Halosimplex pelagicum TaxID=869886 RepID=A0A7D5TEM1_9EURY|nr:AAA family ATPase [Halosimplex pelagicum]QLH84809.1 AAA family ATPase [Halosimplex pelagicum]
MTNLQILSLELKDYRQYKGTQKIDLRTEGDRHINVIEGQNGAGKSNILNAITLCFYGTEEHLKDEKEGGLDTFPLVNRTRLEELNENEEASGYIEIELGDSEPEYVFKREFKTVKDSNGMFNSVAGDLKLQRKVNRDWKPVDNPHTHLNEILPTRVHEYFLFDGERLHEFFEEGYPDRVKTAILDVSHIELLNRSLTHLDKMQTELSREASDFEGEAKRLKDNLDEKEQEKERKANRIEELEGNIAEAESSIDEIDTKLRDSSDASVREKQERRKYLNQRLEKLEDSLEELESDTIESMVEAGPIVYNYEALDFTHEQFAEMANTGQLPPKIQDWFIQELINRGTCICGADLDSNEEKIEHLQELEQEMSIVMQENLEGKAELPRIIRDGGDAMNQLITNRQKMSEQSEELEEVDIELRDISSELKNYDLPEDVDVSKLESQREDLEDRISEMHEEVGKLRGEINTLDDEIEELDESWREEAAKEDKHRVLMEKLEFVEDADTELSSIKETILAKIREDTEQNMNQYFNDLIWKDEDYTIELGDDYTVSVFGRHGDNKIGSLSAGEKQVLALSFMSALTKISGFNAPILIDTPLGRISSKPKNRIAQNLPEYLEDTQITFLMTDEEYTDDVRAYLQNSVANEYILDYVNEITEVHDR